MMSQSGDITDFSTKYTIPSALLLKSLKKSLRNFMWEVAPMSRIDASLQELYEVLNKSLVIYCNGKQCNENI
jgi:hypothetical protein